MKALLLLVAAVAVAVASNTHAAGSAVDSTPVRVAHLVVPSPVVLASPTPSVLVVDVLAA